ncbi:MAG: UDP-N-acetylmuramoyl-L-alanyl-D-glutamate--2,6-diaminopimelate ligase [Pseudomonadales bacterium]
MALAELIAPFEHRQAGSSVRHSLGDLMVSGISDDSRTVKAGDVFIAVSGAAADGHRFAEAAVRRGAVAVLAEHDLETSVPVPVVLVSGLAPQRSTLASRLLGKPSARLECVGVTGTNGKTSIACFIADMLATLGEKAGYLGTIGWGVPGSLEGAALTTESAITVQKRLASLVDRGLGWAIMEVSSHALDQSRVDGVEFHYAVFSNLSRDHLDYHRDYESYGAAKARLFSWRNLRAAVINVDDAFGRGLAATIQPPVTLISYGAAGADLSWSALRCSATGISGRWHTPWGEGDFAVPLFGEFSIANLSAALAVLCHAGFAFDDVVRAAQQVKCVPGRMEFFQTRPGVAVDFAHTPDALLKMLQALRPHVDGRLICVCGCGGDRDPGKRPIMGRIASEHADVVWFTSDNPRSEDPQSIIDAMVAGASGPAQINQCADRRSAIAQAVGSAAPDDLVVIAGKGHETYQEIAGQRLPFSDRALARELSRGSD